MKTPSILFLCAHNAARSQMAEALLRKHAGERFHVVSAGLTPTSIHPMTLRVLDEIGVDTSKHAAKGLEGILGTMRFRDAIVLCAQTQNDCPRIYPFAFQTKYWPFEDPAACEGTEDEKLEKFRAVRDQIEARILGWLKSEGSPT